MAPLACKKKWMLLAIKKARQGIRSGQTPFGACIVQGNKLISVAHNVVWRSTDITAHAEIHALRKACQKLKTIDLSGCVIYSTCEPCPMCFAACHWARISKVVYGAGIQDALKAGFNELLASNVQMKKICKSPLKIQGGFLRKENQALFREWKQLKKSKTY